jgi:DNA-directed RNA polymerase subunit RPC12/RpoP
MAICPRCKKEVTKPEKTWKYRVFKAEFYRCGNCGTKFREYTKNGKHSFTLMYLEGKGYRKAQLKT